MVVDTINLSAVAIVLLRFGPFARIFGLLFRAL